MRARIYKGCPKCGLGIPPLACTLCGEAICPVCGTLIAEVPGDEVPEDSTERTRDLLRNGEGEEVARKPNRKDGERADQEEVRNVFRRRCPRPFASLWNKLFHR